MATYTHSSLYERCAVRGDFTPFYWTSHYSNNICQASYISDDERRFQLAMDTDNLLSFLHEPTLILPDKLEEFSLHANYDPRTF